MFELDRMTEVAKINICSLRYQNANFLEKISDFMPPNHGFRSLGETEPDNVN